MSFPGEKWRVCCKVCGWKGVRTSIQCECYDEYALYCRPSAPGPGCPSGVIWPCPRCGYQQPDARGPHGGRPNKFGSFVVAVAPVKHRIAAGGEPDASS
jgi:hypothetical protein